MLQGLGSFSPPVIPIINHTPPNMLPNPFESDQTKITMQQALPLTHYAPPKTPHPPLSAYEIFVNTTSRARSDNPLRYSTPSNGPATDDAAVRALWHNVNQADYNACAQQDQVRYVREMQVFEEEQKAYTKCVQGGNDSASSEGSSLAPSDGDFSDDSSVVPSDDDDDDDSHSSSSEGMHDGVSDDNRDWIVPLDSRYPPRRGVGPNYALSNQLYELADLLQRKHHHFRDLDDWTIPKDVQQIRTKARSISNMEKIDNATLTPTTINGRTIGGLQDTRVVQEYFEHGIVLQLFELQLLRERKECRW